MISVRPVSGLRDLWTFVNLPWRLYQNDPAWIPPLRLERLLHLSRHNPYFEHGEAACWLAWSGSRPVGRISAQNDRLEQPPDIGHFGFLEAVDEPAVFAALLGAAEDWLTARSIRHISGPFNFSINQECGLLVDGFEFPPVVMMPHNPPYYSKRLEELGYRRAKELLAYWLDARFEHPRAMRSLLSRFQNMISVRLLNRARFNEELALLRDIFNDAWCRNWGFIPFTDREFNALGVLLKRLVHPDWIRIAEVEGRAVAFIVEIPNVNEAARDLDGRVLPFGWWRLYRRIRDHRITSIRVPLMGVRREYQNTPIGAALAYRLIDALQGPSIEKGITGGEMSWILDDNRGMDLILRSIGCRQYKRYRIYEKTL